MAGGVSDSEDFFMKVLRNATGGVPVPYGSIPGMESQIVRQCEIGGVVRWKPVWHRRRKYDYLQEMARARWNV